jgi:hypothetical protein
MFQSFSLRLMQLMDYGFERFDIAKKTCNIYCSHPHPSIHVWDLALLTTAAEHP